jgi:hypothetical protein
MKDAALTTCPKEQCQQKTWGKGAVKRLLGTGAGLIFKAPAFTSPTTGAKATKPQRRKRLEAPRLTRSAEDRDQKA